jgi:hypothetical protein
MFPEVFFKAKKKVPRPPKIKENLGGGGEIWGVGREIILPLLVTVWFNRQCWNHLNFLLCLLITIRTIFII